MTSLLEAAMEYLQAGLSVLPANVETKYVPPKMSWKPFQTRLPTEAELRAWFANRPDGLCVVTGNVSRQLEVIDHDAAGERFELWSEIVQREAPGLLARLVIERSPSLGYHIPYHCQEEPGPSRKLALRKLETPNGDKVSFHGKTYTPVQDPDGRWYVTITLIEIKGERGLLLCHPSPGYDLVQGSWTALPTLSPQERQVLLDAATALNEVPEAVLASTKPALPADDDPTLPGGDFNQRGQIGPVLERHGWTLEKVDSTNQYWRRPGKEEGHSATFNGETFYVFSTNAAPFEGNHPYSPFAVYALLEHRGDFSDAARALRDQGFGAVGPDPAVDLSGILAPTKKGPLSLRDLMAAYPKLRKPVIDGLLREGETMNIISAPKIGKALAVDTPILTEGGWTTMGAIRPGMKVHAADGSLTEVIAVSEVMRHRPCYCLNTRSRVSLIADEHHLWTVQRGKETTVLTTKALRADFKRAKWALPMAKPLMRERASVPLDPWLFGFWLMKRPGPNDRVSVDLVDLCPILDRILKARFSFASAEQTLEKATFTVVGLFSALQGLGLLNLTHIPLAYLQGSARQRRDLLAGLMDGAGTMTESPEGIRRVEFRSPDAELALQVFSLARSLGFLASCALEQAREGDPKGPRDMVVTFRASCWNAPFSSSWRNAAFPVRLPMVNSLVDPIVSVEPVPSVPVRCLEVAHPTGTFLAGEAFMVTHNSWLATDLALSIATGRPWLGMTCEPGNVLILDNELHRETSSNRIPKVAAARGIDLEEMGGRLFVENLRGRLQDLFMLGPYFKQFTRGQFKVVILDAFYRFLPSRVDENDNGTMANLYNYLDAYAEHLRCCFVLIHHTSKGNQSLKEVTDVGAGAGAQSRATDTHLVLRRHEEEDAVVLDAAVRSWPPVAPRCLRWAWPVWTPADDLDPTALRSEFGRRRSRDDDEEEPPSYDAASFAEHFLGEEPKSMARILDEAEAEGLSARRVRLLLELADECGHGFRWKLDHKRVGYATRPQSEQSDGDELGSTPSKRKAVEELLRAQPDLPTSEVAIQCDADESYVRRIRRELGGTDDLR